MDQRHDFVLACLRGARTMTDLCHDYGISRKTGYKWLARFLESGVPGLVELSRAPHEHPHAVDQSTVDALVELRKEHPTWGPKKLLAHLSGKYPKRTWPAQSTVGALLKRHGLVGARRRHCRTPRATHPLAAATEPNIVWCADFKGKFRVGRKYCHPLTISDAHSRFLLECRKLESERTEPAHRVFEEVFHAYGLPLRIRTDNGTPFATRAVGGLSRLSIWWVKLGILPERIEPGHPEQNGRHERMHRTLKLETASPPRATMRAQQAAFDCFRFTYNHERPHEALGQRTPASIYVPSPRPMPSYVGEPEYPDDFELRRVNDNGIVNHRSAYICLSKLLSDEVIGLEEINDDQWQLWFGPIYLGLASYRGKKKGVAFVKNLPVEQTVRSS